MPPPIFMRRIDWFAAHVANGLLTREEALQAMIFEEKESGVPRHEVFANLVYDIAQALLDKSETV